MKTGFIALILTLIMASTVVAGDWGLYIGRIPGPAPHCGPYGCYPPPHYCPPPGGHWYYSPPRAYEFGFFHHRDRDRYRGKDHDHNRGRGHGHR